MFKLSFKQQVLTGFAISLLFVLVSAITSHYSIKKLTENTSWQNHTYDVINLVKDIETQVLNSETGIRGFVLSGERQYLAPYTSNASKILPSIQRLKNLVSDNTAQHLRIDSLDFYSHAKIEEMQTVLRINETAGQAAAAKRVMKGTGQLFKNQILKVSGKIISVELELLKKRKDATIASSKQSEWIVLVSASVIFCLILFLFTYIKRTFDQQKLTENQIRDSNIELERISADNEQKNWLLSGASAVNESMRGEQEIEELASNVVTQICNYTGAQVGALFLISNTKNRLVFRGGYAYQR